jgi:FkbH-like protein
LSDLAARGVLLAACTRNDAPSVDPLLDDLRLPFLTRIYGCDDKASALLTLADQTQIDPADMVFVDDDPLERATVARILPAAALTPDEAVDLPLPGVVLDADLDRLRATQASIAFYRQLRAADDPDAYLASLNFTISCDYAGKDCARATQLYERTSKLNLTGTAPRGRVYAITTSSKIDPPGVNGAFSLSGDTIDSLALSCRLSGRELPEAAVALILRTAKAQGLAGVRGVTVATGKNDAVLDLYERCGFRDGFFDLSRPLPAPRHWTFR